jgi:hypothetical protein
MCSTLSSTVLEQAVTTIESVPDELLSEVVTCIPWQWLADEEKQVILAGLKARRTLVRAALAGYSRGSP